MRTIRLPITRANSEEETSSDTARTSLPTVSKAAAIKSPKVVL